MADFQTILAIDTSCDETSIAIVRRDFSVLANEISSQVARHAEFGGVVPGLAAREHERNLPVVLAAALRAGGFPDSGEGIDAVAVTVRPGLEIALWRGIVFARELAARWRKPLIPVDHLAGHLLSPLVRRGLGGVRFPVVSLLASGGHTELLELRSGQGISLKDAGGSDKNPPRPEEAAAAGDEGSFGGIQSLVSELAEMGASRPDLSLDPAKLSAPGASHGSFGFASGRGEDEGSAPFSARILGVTRDDAAGEAFDKVARMLGYGWPGAGKLCAAAAEARLTEIPTVLQREVRSSAGRLPLPWLDNHFERAVPRREASHGYAWDFSFSGLKTAVRRLILESGLELEPTEIAPGEVVVRVGIAALFEEAATEVLAEKLVVAAEILGAGEIHLCGGVSMNTYLRQKIQDKAAARVPGVTFRAPDGYDLCTDNAAMIGAAAFFSPAAPDPEKLVATSQSGELFAPTDYIT